MKKTSLSLACGLALAAVAAPSAAEVSLSANVALTTDYVWRGMSQNSEDAAIQGGFDLGVDNGLYAGIWGSNVDTGGAGSMELDYYGGWATEFDNGFGLDVGYIYYDFPGADFDGSDEFYIGGSYSYFGLTAYYDNDSDNIYWDASFDYELPEGFGLGVHYGYTDADEGEDMADWKVGITKSMFDLDFELAYTDTDLDSAVAKDWADSRVFLTVSKSWE